MKNTSDETSCEQSRLITRINVDRVQTANNVLNCTVGTYCTYQNFILVVSTASCRRKPHWRRQEGPPEQLQQKAQPFSHYPPWRRLDSENFRQLISLSSLSHGKDSQKRRHLEPVFVTLARILQG
jgi:hypothetical protein